ncbi:Sensor histidine kinase RcsC [Bdellovibrio bacteriovorus]|uniref:hybrid sensor histidine kinase/response regulator n=1 Tax=Bdellovibrio bacteriovorus TaxID=959 RepID=UPI00045BF98F|nr:response regulator [Bdellovibrio bacteriovorus]AHZ85424.1 two-component hybrid sensor and regulator [Bdellovibrio bacteriovorus]BEV69970.1 Sensor histidine kinase RcsC [Bdellovibrio bacteriovorus]
MSPLKPLNILLVEDNDEHAFIISRYLRRVKDVPEITLDRAAMLKTALQQIDGKIYDLVLLDLRLPDSDLDETLPRMQSILPDAPIIILSALEDREFALRKVHEGAQDYLCKSELSSENLVRGIYAAIERKSAEVLMRKQFEQMQTLFDFSNFVMTEAYPEQMIEHLRQSALKCLKLSAVELLRRDSVKVSDEFARSGLWNLRSPKLLLDGDLAMKLTSFRDLREEGFNTCLIVPVKGLEKNQLFGLLLLMNKALRHFSAEEVRFVQSLVNTLSIAMSRNALHKELEERIQQLHTAHRKKDDFLATLSHELRTPLNIIKGGLDLLKGSDPKSREYHDALDAIERNLNHEIQLVSDTLEISRITTGKTKLNLKKVVVQELIQSVMESLESAAHAKNISAQLTCSEAATQAVVDPDRFRQILWNLLSNSIKFTPPGGRLHVTCETHESQFSVSVQDTGQGIESENLPYVFEKFWQEDSGMNRKRMGLGLGLSIAKHMTELHGGSIEVQSPGKDQGTTFRIQLPLVSVETSQGPAMTLTGQTEHLQFVENEPKGSLSGLHIFLVDDSEDTLVLIKRLLQREGALVTDTSQPKKALALLKEGHFDILISDIGMPEMDGYELIRSLRDWEGPRNRHLPAMALSAYTSTEDIRKALESGFQQHLSKPSPIKNIVKEVLRLTGKAPSRPQPLLNNG